MLPPTCLAHGQTNLGSLDTLGNLNNLAIRFRPPVANEGLQVSFAFVLVAVCLYAVIIRHRVSESQIP